MLEPLYKILIVFVTLLIFAIIGKFLGTFTRRLINALGIDELAESIGIKFMLSRVSGAIVSVIFYLLGFYFALNQIGATRLVAIISAFIVVAVLAMAIVLGINDFIVNLFAGIYKRKKYLKKRHLRIGNVSGKIIGVGMTKIKMETKEGELLVVPFSGLK